ncbi:pR25 [rat cytomegalovirus strain Maastricht]|uniref:PR25 n=1 Tax=Rat cytomegalovirus (strain Maastricht) TaxID=79700 RepID=Q9DWG7_RCMVM|nr:pR25 [rat cytomegalovirus strain Maastricht]AAF99122.1 pR25 [rat cytomegalovirus strain Maastricht]WEG71948.1 tegument protein UL25 [Murid betaherpesvirus 2]
MADATDAGGRRERKLFASDDEGSDGSDADDPRDEEMTAVRGDAADGGRGRGGDREDDDDGEDDEALAREMQNGIDLDEDEEDEGYGEHERPPRAGDPEAEENEYMVEDADPDIYRRRGPPRPEAGARGARQEPAYRGYGDEAGSDDDDDVFYPSDPGRDARFPTDRDGYTLIPDDAATGRDAEDPYEVVDIPMEPPKLPRKRRSANRQSFPAPVPTKTRATVSYRRSTTRPPISDALPTPGRPLPPLPNRPPSTIGTATPIRQPAATPATGTGPGFFFKSRSLPPLKRTSSTPAGKSQPKRPDPRTFFQQAIRISTRPVAPPESPTTPEAAPPDRLAVANANNNARFNQVNRDPPSSPSGGGGGAGIASSPRARRELGFSATVLTGNDVRFIKACLHDAYVHQAAMLNSCVPMPPYVLQTLAEPIISRRAVRMAELVRPMIRAILLINYYHIGTGRLARMRNLARRAMNPTTMESLRRKLGPLLPPQDSAAPPLPLRMLGRLNITDMQHAACAVTLDRLLKPTRENERRAQHMECARAFRAKNLLFKAFRFNRDESKEVFLRNLAILNDDADDEGEITLVIETQPYPTRDAIVNDAVFCLALGNMIHSFDRALADLRAMIHLQLEDLTETMYFAYVQLPVLRDDFRVFYHEVANEVNSVRIDTQGLASLARRMLAFARRCYDSGAFVVPRFVRYLTRCASLWDAGYLGFSMERAAASLASPDLLRPNNTETAARKLLRRTTHFTKIEPPTASGPQMQVTHVPGNSTTELAVRAAHLMTTVSPRLQLPDEATAAAVITGAIPRRGSLRGATPV